MQTCRLRQVDVKTTIENLEDICTVANLAEVSSLE